MESQINEDIQMDY